MNLKNKILLLLFCTLFLSSCGNYQSYTKTIKVTFASQSSDTSEVSSKSQALENTENYSDITENRQDTVSVTDNSDKSNTDPSEHKIYYTKTGKSYHYDDECGRGTYYECTLEEALEKGLEPCKKCVK